MNLVVGVGLRTGTSYAELQDLVTTALHELAGEVGLVVTITGKENEPALQELVAQLGAELRTFSKDELAKQPVPTPSEQVEQLKGTPSVAEAAVLATGAQLLVPKQQTPNTTIAIGVQRAGGYGVRDREVVQRVIAERRDVRRGFLDLPVDDVTLGRVLEAAHRAPSVGLSQPWDFLVIRNLATRRKVHDLATAQRDAFAASLPEDRRAAFDGLKIEAILDTPLNLAVTCDPGRGGRHVLGRHADPRTTMFSAAIAIQNLWLAARAEGLGVGWVSFFEPGEVAAVLDLPAHIELVGYLCVGYVDEFAAAPELVRSGWAKRRPLSWAIHHEEWGRRDTSIVDDALQAAQNAVPATGQRVHVIVGGDASHLRQADVLVVDLHKDRPPADFGVLWRPARTPAEAVEFGVEIARDLALQGVGNLVVQLEEKSERAEALARGLQVGASACGLTHSTT
ncbi:cob(II)yrinic acid a,c-diamide reductase [Kribbella sp. VKM Ac-2571]|uniref:5,6-dimethylbenzimidazole synthase n=1 Tax=Kribbella sp. VKM Ac-2571 TaxID=2512222 RepID=UPI00105D1AB0|nr:5,6-dimethylbenzimidazole synthase [Kribbella sp. VKM Ac-2571]TDO61091.1 cob(II)yrinic acid a,c-diamide reductase [Kribbella sp. VKM Ac-2571]